jgi:hypothetical protein
VRLAADISSFTVLGQGGMPCSRVDLSRVASFSPRVEAK